MSLVLRAADPSITAKRASYFADAMKKGPEAFRSAWIPVFPGNFQMLKPTDIVIDSLGLEMQLSAGRKCTLYRDGKAVRESGFTCAPASTTFVWVDPRTSDPAKYLENNPFKQTYHNYNLLMRRFLKCVALLVSDVKFPLFHGTSLEFAKNIQMNGFDFAHVVSRDNDAYGFSFNAAIKLEQATSWGYWKGAVIQLRAADTRRPIWLNINDENEGSDMDMFIRSLPKTFFPRDTAPKFNWQHVCRDIFRGEQPVSAVYFGAAFIFNPQEEYAVDKVIT